MLNYSIFQEAISFLQFGRASASAVIFLILCIVLARALLSVLSKRDA
jgi:ABC-type sugar transport system permease subunit